MTTAFTYPPYPSLYPAVQRTPERGIATPLGLAGNSQPQHAAPRRQPGSEAVTLRAGCIGIQHRYPHPTPSREAADVARDPHRVPVSDQPVGRCIGLRGRCVRLTQAGRLIADALCVGTEYERTTGVAYRLNTPVLTTRNIEMSPGLATDCASVASDLGSGVWTNVRALEDPTVQIAGGVGQHGDAPLVHASSHGIESVETFSRKELSMGLRGPQRPLTQVALDAAEEAEDSAIAYVMKVEESISDRRITDDELIDMAVARQRMERAHRNATVATEHADIGQSVAMNLLRGGIAESTRLRARDAGMIVPEFQIDMPQDAA